MINARIAHQRGIDMNDPELDLRIAAERLSTVRYVFIVQVEDGIASAAQRAALEYADAVLIGWPDDGKSKSSQVQAISEADLAVVKRQIEAMEGYIAQFADLERAADVDAMADRLIRICECVAQIRRCYQPTFPLPTFAEIRRVVQEEWDEDMGRIDASEKDSTAATIEQETEHADELHEQAAQVQDKQGTGHAASAGKDGGAA